MKLDNPFNPKEGHQMEIGVGFSHPILGGATTYTILMANLASNNHLLGPSLRHGVLHPK